MDLFLFGLISFVIGFIFAFFYEKVIPKVTGKQKLVFAGYKLHHSLYGILLIVLAFLLKGDTIVSIFLISSGVGIIMEHYVTGGGLDFITKE